MKNYYYSLDLFRGFCGYGVAISHLYAFAYENIYMEYMSLIFAEFFFLLSGFVLYPQLIKVINNKKKFSNILQEKMDENFTSFFYSIIINFSAYWPAVQLGFFLSTFFYTKNLT